MPYRHTVQRFFVFIIFATNSVLTTQAASSNTEQSLLALNSDQQTLTPPKRELISPPPQQEIHEHAEYMPYNPQLNAPQENRPEVVTMPRMSFAGPDCDEQMFTYIPDNQMGTTVQNEDTQCINKLFSLTSTSAYYTFKESKMIAVAQHLKKLAQNYNANRSNGIDSIILFLRAGYYVQYYHPQDVGKYGKNLKTHIRQALKVFFNNPQAWHDNQLNSNILGEAFTLIDSARENTVFLPVIRRALRLYNSQHWNNSQFMGRAVNSVFTVLFRGHYLDSFVQKVKSDPRILSALKRFHDQNTHLLGTDDEYLLSNAVRELARFLQHKGSIKQQVKPLLIDILNQYNMGGSGASIWVGVAEMVDYYDHNNCDDYNICNFKEQLANKILSISYQCNDYIKIRAQKITQNQLDSVCQDIFDQEAYFHRKLATNQQPVADDYNETLQVNIFDSSRDYKTYAGILFDISTDNGGMYLEGDPEIVGNQANFVAYRAQWLNSFHVWNLKHETVHYLDGRYNLYGKFSDYPANSVWWSEGLAEYISKKNDNPQAMQVQKEQSYSLERLFQTSYQSGAEQVYRGGYLAVRFMFEIFPDEVTTLLEYMRVGNFDSFTQHLERIDAYYDSDFQSWFQTISDPNYIPDSETNNDEVDENNDRDTEKSNENTNEKTKENNHSKYPSNDKPRRVVALNETSLSSDDRLYKAVYLPKDVKYVWVELNGGEGDADMFIDLTSWATPENYSYSSSSNGNRELISINYADGGQYLYITLDAHQPFSNVSLSVSYEEVTN